MICSNRAFSAWLNCINTHTFGRFFVMRDENRGLYTTHVIIIGNLTMKITVNFREKFNIFTKKDVTFLIINTR